MQSNVKKLVKFILFYLRVLENERKKKHTLGLFFVAKIKQSKITHTHTYIYRHMYMHINNMATVATLYMHIVVTAAVV